MALTAKQRNDPRRPGLLAKVHIAPKELGISDEDVKTIILPKLFKKTSRKDLTVMELQFLEDYFIQHGWKPKPARQTAGKGSKELQVEALRERAEALAKEIENGSRRLRGLVKKFCKVEDLKWVRQVEKLKRILAALEEIKRSDK